MAVIYFIISAVFVVSALGADMTNYEDEIDPVIDLLINGDYDTLMEINENVKDENEEEIQPVFLDNIWKCGNCSNMGKLKVIYNETYNFDTNYNVYDDEPNMEIQIGLSLHDMQCITIKAEEDSEVHRVSGACAGDDVTLSIANAINCVISVYSLGLLPLK